MKSFLKLGSLFALIIAGRYMQLAQPAASAGLAKAPVTFFAPSSATNVTLTNYTKEEPTTITPVNQRKQQALPLTWF
ncbi:MAG: hypothetical protein ACRYF0_00735 [Janthinobacterium lividum]